MAFPLLALIPNEYLGADFLTSLSALSCCYGFSIKIIMKHAVDKTVQVHKQKLTGLYAPGDGVTKGLGSFGLMWSEGALGSSLPVISKQTCWIKHLGINQT